MKHWRVVILDRLTAEMHSLLGNHSHDYSHPSGQASTYQSSSRTSPSGNQQPQQQERATKSGKRSRTSREKDHLLDESDEDDRETVTLKARLNGPEYGNLQKLACPYYKRSPHKYSKFRSCKGPGWDSVHRLK